MKPLSLHIKFNFTLAVALICLSVNLARLQAVSQAQLDKVRTRNVLTDQDLQILDNYVTERFAQMTAATDSAELSRLSHELLEKASGKMTLDETQRLYAKRYTTAVKADYRQLYEQGTIAPDQPESLDKELADQKRLVAAVILATTADVEVIEDIVALLADASSEVRYWAAKGLADRRIYDYLVAAESDDPTAQVIWNGIRACLEKEQSGNVVAQIAATALVPKNPGSIELLQMCVKIRLDQYQSWQVDNELSDLELLQQILRATRADMLGQSEQDRSTLVRAAADLYSVAFHRYNKGKNYTDSQGNKIVLLNPACVDQLETLLIEGEKALLRSAESPRREAFLPALLRGRPQDVEKAYNTLLSPKGLVDQAFQIYIGENDGPANLPDPTAKVVQRAITLTQIRKNAIGPD